MSSSFLTYLSQEEIAAHMAEWGTWMEGLKQQGKLKGGLPFTPESAAVLSDNGNQVSDGFYTEPNNVSVGGYIELNAENLNEAIPLDRKIGVELEFEARKPAKMESTAVRVSQHGTLRCPQIPPERRCKVGYTPLDIFR